MRESRLSGSVEGVVCKHDSYSDWRIVTPGSHPAIEMSIPKWRTAWIVFTNWLLFHSWNPIP